MNKYHSRKCGRYDSKRESKRAWELALLQRDGVISDLREQVRFELLPKQDGERAVHYIADFVYQDQAGKTVVEDAKGMKTRDYILKRKLMLFRHGIRVQEI